MTADMIVPTTALYFEIFCLRKRDEENILRQCMICKVARYETSIVHMFVFAKR